MPTFPSHWAGISGSIEPTDSSPLAAAQRELEEETNLRDISVRSPGGLYVDVQSPSGKRIRVYPFTVNLPAGSDPSMLELRGTEHDLHKFITFQELIALHPTVPGLVTAFHHATFGKYLDLPDDIRAWESDRMNGAAELARQAVKFGRDRALEVAMLRPTMVPIVNVMHRLAVETDSTEISEEQLIQSLHQEAERCIEMGVKAVRSVPRRRRDRGSLSIATFSRSSTVRSILERVQSLENGKCSILVGRSTPGNEGEIAAKELQFAECVADDELERRVEQGEADIVLVGADCIMTPAPGGVINKVGTKSLAVAAAKCKKFHVPVICCADRWKLWADTYPPPLEDIFEVVPRELFDQVLVPAGDDSLVPDDA